MCCSTSEHENKPVEQAFLTGVRTLRDFIAPKVVSFIPTILDLAQNMAITMYVYGYPRQIFTGWSKLNH